MSYVNRKRVSASEKLDEKVQAEGHANWMGGHSFDISDPIVHLRIAASTCFFGEPQYYHTDTKDKRSKRAPAPSSLTDEELTYLRETLDAIDPQDWRGLSPAALMEKAIDAALDHDPGRTLLEAARLRNEEHIRTTPQVILVRASHHPKVRGTGMVRALAWKIIKRADEPAVGLAYHVAAYGKDAPIPNALKKAWRVFLERQDEFHLAKYRMDSREAKTVDVVNLVHPKSPAIHKLVKGELKLSDETWEALISKEGSNTAAWTKALGVMGHMALLRNIRNLIQHDVPVTAFVGKLVEGAKTGQQLPFRYFSAFKAVENETKATGRLKDAIEECMLASMGNLPRFKGRVMSLCDNSGSAWGAATSSMGTMKMAEIGNLQAILTAMRADDGHVGIFGNKLETFAVRERASVFDQLKQANALGQGIGHDTENGIWLFWDKAIREKEMWDTVFVFSDMQAGHGGLYGLDAGKYSSYVWRAGNDGAYRRNSYIDVPKLITEYRRKVNPDVMVYLVQIAGYQDTIMPEWYDKTFILGGWGEGLLRFAAAMAGMYGKQTAQAAEPVPVPEQKPRQKPAKKPVKKAAAKRSHART